MKGEYIIYIVLITILLFVLVWGVNITIKQLEFKDDCKNSCLSKSLDYETRFVSYPWNNVNGRCYCKNVTVEKIK